jgi:site-specific recombinase XerD
MRQGLYLKLAQWPEPWRTAWEALSIPPDSLFTPAAAATDLRPATKGMYLESICLYLGFLQRHNRLTAPFSPANLVTQANVEAFADEQQARNLRNSTIRMRLATLAAGVRLIFPRTNVRFITHPAGRTLDKALPYRPRRVDIRDHREILQCAIDLNKTAMAGAPKGHNLTALRDAALIGVLAWVGIRRRALTIAELGQNLNFKGGRYWISFDSDDTKTGSSFALPLPVALNKVLHDYIHIARPALGGAATPALWMSSRRGPLSPRGIDEAVRARTLQWFGTKRGTHWFRKCITTTIRLTHPELALDAAIVLDHSLAVAEKHYDMATVVTAAQRHDKHITEKVAKTALRADAAFKRVTPPRTAARLRLRGPGAW